MFSRRAISIINRPKKERGSYNTVIKEREEEISITIETADILEKKYLITEEDEKMIEAFLMNNEACMSHRTFLELSKSIGETYGEPQNHPLVLLNVFVPNETSEYGRIENYKMNPTLKRYLSNH